MGKIRQLKGPEKGLKESSHDYSSFHQINGLHPLQEVEGCFITYQARKRYGGKVAFFNFDLAKEVGLIGPEHGSEINAQLEKKILETFSIVIINEYDIINKVPIPPQEILPNRYMATRYLQLQHPNKKGKTSGDGRSIWNGRIEHKGRVYDVSSCGTGATCLSPATHLKKKFFQTGDPSISYGCGHSELDEGLGTLFFSEVFNRNKIETERILAIIEFPNKIAINVRVHHNLLRPSHFFAQLKQGHYQVLKNLVDYHINRQQQNKIWTDVPKNESEKYKYFLRKQTEIFATMAARFEDDYIFCWMDWDGDNVLMNGGIIDYGSIRQFGLFHHEYRFDDVERFSTTILEQRLKARYTVQTFAQLVDFLLTKKKKNINHFNKHPSLKHFDQVFEECKNKNLLYKIGFHDTQISFLNKVLKNKVEDFRKVFSYFEKTKSVKGPHRVADGINWSAVFCMRDILRELPQLFLMRENFLTDQEFIEIIQSNYAVKKDLAINDYRSRKIREFQTAYLEFVDILAKISKTSREKILLEITMRSSVINKYDRVTGDSITHLVLKVMNARPKYKPHEIYQILVQFVDYQNLDPETKLKGKILAKGLGKKTNTNRMRDITRPMRGILQIIRDCREGL